MPSVNPFAVAGASPASCRGSWWWWSWPWWQGRFSTSSTRAARGISSPTCASRRTRVAVLRTSCTSTRPIAGAYNYAASLGAAPTAGRSTMEPPTNDHCAACPRRAVVGSPCPRRRTL